MGCLVSTVSSLLVNKPSVFHRKGSPGGGKSGKWRFSTVEDTCFGMDFQDSKPSVLEARLKIIKIHLILFTASRVD